MTKCKNIKKLKIKKIPSKESKIIRVMSYFKNYLCYSIIYYPKKSWREPLNNLSSLAPESHSTIKIDESGIINYFISSLQANREIYTIVYKREKDYILDFGIIYKSEFKKIK